MRVETEVDTFFLNTLEVKLIGLDDGEVNINSQIYGCSKWVDLLYHRWKFQVRNREREFYFEIINLKCLSDNGDQVGIRIYDSNIREKCARNINLRLSVQPRARV